MSTTVDEYIAEQPEEIQPILNEFRDVIRKNAPEATEVISWGMATYKMPKNLIHFAAQKNHVGLHPGPDAVAAFSDKLPGFKTSKGTIQFPYNKPIPFGIIEEIVRYNVEKAKKSST